MTGTSAIRATAVDIPGLFNLELPDGRHLYDMTVGQSESIARQNGWRIERADWSSEQSANAPASAAMNQTERSNG